jgi:iron complex outermembrane recepter protein
MKTKYLTSSAMLLVAWAATPALAQNVSRESAADEQSTAQQDGGIGEIIVTAQRREESVQRTALAIEVFDSETLQQRGVTRPDDITKLATGVQLGGGTTPVIYVRGVGDFSVIATANPAVVTNFNGVPISRPQAIGGNFFDLERLEVLKGPQGTLYGRNATGGALNLIAARPRLGELSGYLNGTVGNYSAFAGEGAINLPLGDTAALRLATQISDRDGYLSDGSDDDKHQSFRAQLLLEPSDALTLQLRGGYIHLGGVGAGVAVQPKIPGASPWTGSASTTSANYYLGLAASNFNAALAAGCNPAPNGTCPPPPVLFDRPDAYTLFQDIENWNIDAQLDYDFGGATLTIIPGYRKIRARFSSQPQGFNYTPGGFGTDGERSEQHSIEARIGNSGDRLKWVAGLFYLNESQSTDFAVNTGLIQRVRIASDLDTETYAVFGEATLSVSDSFRLIAGARHTWDKRGQENLRKFAVSPTVVSNCLPPAALPGTQCALLPLGSIPPTTASFKQATWKIGAEVDLAEQSMLFATVSTGFKAGGFNQAVDPANPGQSLAFNPEKITAYTLGLRNRFLDNRLQVNLEGFYWDYSDLQISTLISDGAGIISLTTQNAGKARIYGANFEIVAKPALNTTLRFGVEYLNSKYRDFSFIQAAALTAPGSTGCPVTPAAVPPGPLGPFVSINCSGFPLALAPKWSGNASISQVVPLANGSNITINSDLAFAAKRFTAVSYVPNSIADAYGIWSASVTYNAENDRWFLGAFVRNITEATAYTGGPGGTSPFITGFVTGSISAPRTFGARFGVRF